MIEKVQLDKFDLFKHPRDNHLVGSKVGGIVSILIVILTSIFASYLFNSISSGHIITSKTEITFDNGDNVYSFPPFVLQYQSNKVDSLVSPYFTLIVRQCVNTNGIRVSNDYANLTYGSYFVGDRYVKGYATNKSFVLQGLYSSKTYQFITVELSKCVYDTNLTLSAYRSDVVCKSLEEIEDFIKMNTNTM